jgi:hypothetical protein
MRSSFGSSAWDNLDNLGDPLLADHLRIILLAGPDCPPDDAHMTILASAIKAEIPPSFTVITIRIRHFPAWGWETHHWLV